MAKRYLLDTNAVIDYMGGRFNNKQKTALNNIIDNEINLSVINKIELLSFHLENKNISEFIENANILELNNKVADITVDIRKKYKTKLPDAIILTNVKFST